MADMELLQARSALYSLISALFSYPTSEKFAVLFDGDYRVHLSEASEQLDKHNGLNSRNLRESVGKIYQSLTDDREAIEEIYISVFGHTLSKETAPYELEHLVINEVFQRTQRLADINGFYRAFGLEIDTRERADHISVQAEFLAWLILKEIHANKMADGEELAAISREAQSKFWRDHFGGWVPVLRQALSEPTIAPFYRTAADFLGHFLEFEEAYLNLEPVEHA